MGRRRHVHHVRVYIGDPDMTWREWRLLWGTVTALIVGFFLVTCFVLIVTGNFMRPADPLPPESPTIPHHEFQRIRVQEKPTPPALPPYHAPDPVITMPSMAPPILDQKPEPEVEVEAPVRPSKKPWIELEPRDWEKKGGGR